MLKSSSQELPDCFYQTKPVLISPLTPTPKHSLYLSNLDDQKFLRFSIKYLYLFKKSVSSEILKYSLSRVLVDYYPLAGRIRSCKDDDKKLEVDCNGEGAVFAEAFLDFTADQFLELSKQPNRSWRQLLYRVEARSFLDIPPLIIQVTNLTCGGMILCTGINHCLCDGLGTSQFLHAWAHIATKPNLDIPITPFHTRHVLKPRNPPQIAFKHPGYLRNTLDNENDLTGLSLSHYLQSLPLVATSLTFTSSHILHLKRKCVPSLKCTTFETLASHTWRCWVTSLDLSPSLNVKLLFSVNVRKKLIPELPQGYYGNGFVLGCAQTSVQDLTNNNLHHGVKLVQAAKSCLSDDYVRSMVDLLEDKMVKTDLSTSMVISQWSKLGLEDVDFGEGKALHMGPLSSDIYCLFLPVLGDVDAVTVLVSVPENVAAKFEYYMLQDFWDYKANDGDGDGFRLEENGLI
ncbi:alcohol acyltransferase 9 [Mercurialis annua]|uniref:alcohol acyltransferase 9 n=1 Tax=Mercurialis annua TaxID=3986 RepID=UPI002160BEF6|nr:alcohol acyltransferase 9 [Mercurialis annua]